MEKLRQCRNNYRKGGCFDGKKHSEKEKTSLDSPSPKLNKSMIAYHETGDLFADTCEIVESAQSIAYAAVDTILVQRNWLLGKRIAIECLNENGKADYGKKTMKKLSAELKEKYGKGFDFSSLYKYVKFHQEFPQILDSLRPKSGRPLSWTHYRILLQETSPEARAWYAKEAQEQLEEEIKDVRDQNSKLQIQVNKSSVEAVDAAQKKQKEAEKKMEQAEAYYFNDQMRG